ncbi:ferredoxin [Streptomyces sp. NPDC049687]|uniref:ferredoxin n=1 Tax=Streptomyces sp. NPDC049687 TaxID=3365596 RepID=UPI0037AD6A18
MDEAVGTDVGVDESVGTDEARVGIRVDRDRCASTGLCALFSPEFFDQSETDGRVLPRARDAALGALPALRAAAARCPAEAITVVAPSGRGERRQMPD